MDYKTIPDMFLNVTSQFSSKSLYHYKKDNDWIGIKGSDVKSTVKNIAAALQSIGVKGGDKVAILSTNSPRWSMSDYAIICIGTVTVSVYQTLLSAQVEYILDNFLNNTGKHVTIIFDGKGDYDKINKENIMLFEGVSYKKGTDILDESQQLMFATSLAKNGYKVVINDNDNVVKQLTKKFGSLFAYNVQD